MITFTDVVKRYGELTVLDHVNLQIPEGQLTTILGPSGSGKSTLLRCMNRLECFEHGTMSIAGVEVPGTDDVKLSRAADRDLTRHVRLRVGIVFQNFNLFPHLTALENVTEAPVVVKRTPRKGAIEIGRHYLDRVGLADKQRNYPAQLSGGQQQRVAIARALAMEPDVVLFDEPTSALDPRLIKDVERLMRALDELGKTLVVVSHDTNFARAVSDQVIYFEHGKAIESGSPAEIFDNPKQAATRAFMSSFNAQCEPGAA